MRACVDDLVTGAFTYAPPTLSVVQRAMAIDQRYADMRLGLVDASIVALAEELGIRRIATRDVRHFAAIRMRDGRSFELVVQPSRPDQS